MFAIRSARPDELDALSELCLRSKAHWGYEPSFIDACRAALSLTEDDIGSSMLMVGTYADQPAGVVQLRFEGSVVELDKLFIEPAFIGKGIGRDLMQWAIETARHHGATKMLIASDPDAEPFYTLFGARKIGEIESEAVKGRFLPRLELLI